MHSPRLKYRLQTSEIIPSSLRMCLRGMTDKSHFAIPDEAI
jgi:hypothetical protein